MDESSDTPNLVPHLKSYTDSQFHVVDKTFARADFGFIDDINGFRKIIKNHLKSYIKSQTVRYIILRDLHENFTEAEIDVLHEEKFRLGLSNTDDTVDLLVCKMKDPKGTSQIGKAVCTPYLVPHLKPVPPLSLESMYTTPDDATVPAIGFDTESDLVCLSDSDDDIYVVDDDDIKGDGVMTWENSDDDDVEYELVETDDEFKEFPDGNVWQFELPPSLYEEFDVPDLDELPILESSIGEKVLESNNDDDNDDLSNRECPNTGKILDPCPISKETTLKSCLKKPCKASGEVEVKEISIQKCKEIKPNEQSDKLEKPNDMSKDHEYPKTKILNPGPISKETSLKSCLKKPKTSGEIMSNEPSDKFEQSKECPKTKILDPGPIPKKTSLKSCLKNTAKISGEVEVILTEAEPNRKENLTQVLLQSCFKKPTPDKNNMKEVSFTPSTKSGPPSLEPGEIGKKMKLRSCFALTQSLAKSCVNAIPMKSDFSRPEKSYHKKTIVDTVPGPFVSKLDIPGSEASVNIVADDNISHTQTDNSNMANQNLAGNKAELKSDLHSQELTQQNPLKNPNTLSEEVPQHEVIDLTEDMTDENLTGNDSGVNFGSSSTQELSSKSRNIIKDSNKVQPRVIDHAKNIGDENLTEDNSGVVSSLDKVKIIQPRIIDHTKTINDENLTEDNSREVSGSKQKTLFRKLKTTDKVKAIRPHIVDVTYLSDSDSDSSGSTKMPLDPNHLRQLRNSKVVDLSVYRSSQHKSPEEQDEQNVEELFPKINSSQSQQSKIVTTYNSGMLDPRMIQNSEMQLPSTVQNPGIQQPMMFQNPGMQQPGIVQNPEIQQPRMVQLPEMQQPRMVQNPEMQQPRKVQNPEMQQPRMTQNPEMQQPRMVQNHGMQQPRMIQNSVMQQPRFVQNPEIQQPRMVQNPGMQQPRMIQNPEMQQPRMIQNPEMQQPRMIQYPVMQQPRMVQNLPRMVQNTEMQPPRMIQNPGIHQPRIIQNPKMQQPRMIQNPGIQQPMMVQNPGMQQPGMPQTPGMQQPRIVQNPGIQQPMMVQNPGMQQPGMPQTPGMQQPRIVHNHEIQQPRLVQNLNMQLPRMSQNRGMQQPGIAQNPEIQQPRMIQNPEIQQPRMIQNTGMRQPGMIQNPGMQQQRMNPEMQQPRMAQNPGMQLQRLNPEMQQPRMVQNPEIQQPRIVQNPGTHQLQIDQKRFPELVHYPSTIQRQFSNTTVMQPSGFVHLVTSQTGVQNPTPGVHQSLIGVQQTSPGVQQSHPGVQQPPSGVQQPLIRVQQPYSGVRLASATFQQPPPGVQQPPPGVQQPPSGVQQPPSGVQQPLIGVQQPHSGVRLASATFQQPPPVVQQPPLGVQQTPSGVQQTSSGVQQPPPGVQQTPSEVQQFSSGVQQPFATIQQASLGVQQPLLGVHQPPLRVQQLPSRVQQSPFEFRQPLHGIQQPPHGSQHHPHEIQEPSHKIQESLPLGILPAIGSTLSVKKASKNPQMSLASYYDEQDAMYGPSEPTDNKSDKKPPLPLEPPLPKEPPSPKEPPLSSPKTMKIETPISPSTNTHGSIPKPTVLPINESSENKSLPSELVENEKGQVSVDNEQNKPAPVKYKQNEPALDENDQTEPALNDGEKPKLDEKKVVKLKQQKRKMEDMYKETLKSTKKMRRDIDEALKQRKRDIEIKKEKEQQRKRDIEEEKKRQHLVAIERRERRLMAKIETENELKRAELKLNAKKRCHESKTWAKHVVNLVETPALDSVEKPALDSFEKSTLDSVQQPPLHSKEMLALDLVETHVKDPVETTITASGEEINPRTAIDKTIEYQLTELTSCAQNLLKNQHEKLKETAKGVLNNVLVGPQGHTQPSGKKNMSLHSYVDELLDNTYDQYDPAEPTNEETEDGDIVAYDESIHEPNVDLDTCDQEYKENVDGATEKDEKIQQYASIGFKDTICEPKIEERVNVHTRSPSAIEKELYGEDYQPIEIEYPPEESDEEVEYIQEEPLVEEKYVPEESDELERELYGDDYTPIEIKYEDPDKNEFDEADIFERNKEEDFYITQMEQFRKSMHNQNESSEVQDMDDTTSLITISDTEPCINDTDQISNPKMVEEKRSASESEDGLILSHIEILGELEELETKVKVPHRQGTTKKLKERFIAYQSVKSEEPEISEMPTEEDLEEFYKISASAERKTSPRGRKIAGHGPILCYNTPKNHNIPDNQQSMPNQNNVPNQQGLPNQENSADLSNQQHENVQAMIQISDCNKQKADQYHRQKFKKQRYKSKKKPYISKQQQPRQHIVHGVTQAKQETQNENMPRQHSESNQPSKHQHQNEIYPIESKQTLKNETSNPNKGKVLLPTPNIAISLGSSSTSVSDNITGTSKPANHNKEKQPEAQNRRKVLLPTPVQAKAVEKTAVFPTALEVSQPPFHGNINQLPSEVPADQATVFEVSQPPSIVVTTDQSRGDVDLRPPVKEQNATKIFSKDLDLREKETVDRDERKITPKKDTDHRSELSNKDLDLRDHTHYGNQEKLSQKGHKITQDSDLRGEMNTQSLNQKEKIGIEDSDLREKGETQDSNQRIQTTLLDSDQRKLDVDQRDRKPLLDTKPSVQSSSSVNTVIQDKIGKRGRSHAGGDLRGKSYERANPRGQDHAEVVVHRVKQGGQSIIITMMMEDIDQEVHLEKNIFLLTEDIVHMKEIKGENGTAQIETIEHLVPMIEHIALLNKDILILIEDTVHIIGSKAHLKEAIAPLNEGVALLREDLLLLKEHIALEDTALLKEDVLNLNKNMAHLIENMGHLKENRDLLREKPIILNEGIALEDIVRLKEDLILSEGTVHLNEDLHLLKEDIAHIKTGIMRDSGIALIETTEDIVHLKEDIAHLKEDIVHLREDMVHLKEDIVHVKEDVVHLKEDIAHLKEGIVHLKEDIVHLKEDEVRLKEDIVHLKEDKVHLKEGMDHLKGHKVPLEKRMKENIGIALAEMKNTTENIGQEVPGIVHQEMEEILGLRLTAGIGIGIIMNLVIQGTTEHRHNA
ncbi:unnamed protein product [Owenia fusiformis]|uniref:Uncharacterized protein n=1 Tax=Owenia fusiformis TaxID=6347 RepID=A0A8S4P3I1_OWEFU|nr:unnamed protein product [Owenia fusiformis]